MATVQRAINELVRDGFVEAHPGMGTFVAKKPPHLCNYGVLIPAEDQWSRYFYAIRQASEIVEESENVHMREYLTSSDVTSRRGVMELSRDVISSKLGGLIIASPLHNIETTPALKQVGLPRVFAYYNPQYGLPTVAFDMWHSFVPRAVEYLTSQGCRRIAHLRVVSYASEIHELHKALERTGVERRSYWEQAFVTKALDETVANSVELLMHLEVENRPDALIIHDDNLVDGAVAGLLAARVKVPQQIKVVAHCNYPTPASSALQIKRLGYDCRMLLRECLKIIEMIRDGLTPPEYTKLPALFEDEID